ncbi:MAG: S49 family peptidase [Phycisphaerae bacterium]|nr:S49 family peptidase [Phycisphaerae bacterium]
MSENTSNNEPPPTPLQPTAAPSQDAAQVPPPPPPGPPPWWAYPPRRRSTARRVFRLIFTLIFISSIVLNLYLIVAVTAEIDRPFEKAIISDGAEDQIIAVYDVKGIINNKVASQFAGFCAEIKNDKNVKAVILRIDSHGGGVGASDRIYSLIKGLKEAGKKIVVSMGGVAASGGYYISAPAHEIVAEPTTITGSVGVIMGWLVIKDTLNKIGAEAVVIKSSNARGWKDEVSPFRKPDDRQLAHLREILDETQGRFEYVVKEGRAGKLKTNKVTYPLAIGKGEDEDAKEVWHTEIEPFNGKVYLAKEALQLGLIDAIGYEELAFDRAKALAGLSKPKVVRYVRRKGLFERLMGPTPRGLKLDVNTLDELQAPRIMMIWKVQ